MNHTKEKWEVKTQKCARYWKAEVRTATKKDGEGHYTDMGQLIAVCYGKNTVDNAYLISIAPDMYELLKNITEIEQTAGSPCPLCGGGFDHKDYCIIPQAEKILSRAETRRNNE